jgi:hypothetical protein
MLGVQAPFSHVNPVAHPPSTQAVRHCPSAQTFASPHSLEYLQVFVAAVQAPATQASPEPQSAAPVHGQGPSVPPQAWQVPETQALPAPQSVFVVHSFAAGGVEPGGVQTLFLQTSPWGHALLSTQETEQPAAVHVDPGGQLALPVHDAFGGGATFEQPYASHA